MTQEEFVRNLNKAVLDSVVAQTTSTLLKPPGRQPDLLNQSVANWYRSLSDEHQQHARKFAELCAEGVFFGMLVVLDNLRAIEGTKGELQLIWKNDNESVLLNDPAQENLHDIFQQLRS